MSEPDGREETSIASAEGTPAEDAPEVSAAGESDPAAAAPRPDAADESRGAGGIAPSQTPEGSAEIAEELPSLVAVLEAALFASAEAVPLSRLTRVLGAWTRGQVAAALKALAERQEREGAGIRVVETAGGFQLRSVADYAPWVRKFFAEKPPRLSRAVLETLAIVAYRQPVTRGEIEAVRGVNSDAVLGTLTARGLIQVVGRRASPGTPLEYGTTQEFLELFSLKGLEDLPPLPDPSSLANLIEESRRDEDGEETIELSGAEAAVGGGCDEPEVEAGKREQEDGDARASAEDLEPGGDRLPTVRRGADPAGARSSQREGRSGVGDEG